MVSWLKPEDLINKWEFVFIGSRCLRFEDCCATCFNGGHDVAGVHNALG